MASIARRVLVVTSYPNSSGVTALRGAASALGVEMDVVHAADTNAVRLINDAERVIYRLSPRNFSFYQELLIKLPYGKPRDILESALLGFDKIEIARIFQLHSIPHPQSWVLKKEATPTDFPIIIKIRNGNQGTGVGLLKNPSDYTKFVREFPNESDYLLQEYIENAVTQDKRIFVVGNKIVAAMQRTSTVDDFRSNLHTGGSALAYIPTDEEIQLAVKVAKAFNLQYGGVDIIDGPHGPLVLEVNPSPGFAISKITGTDVAREVITGVMND